MRRFLFVLGTVLFGVSVGWSQAPPTSSATPLVMPTAAELPWSLDGPIAPEIDRRQRPSRLPSPAPRPLVDDDEASPKAAAREASLGFTLSEKIPNLSTVPPVSEEESLFEGETSGIRNALATMTDGATGDVQSIPSFVAHSSSANRIVRYEVPLDDFELNHAFRTRGIEGQLIEIPDQTASKNDSIGDRLVTFLRPNASRENTKTIRMVRYEVPADDIVFHAQLSELDGKILEPGMLRLPEVRFFQPKARVFMDLKQDNEDEFDLFNDGAILASLDVVEFYFPMPLISERFAEMCGKSGQLSSLGWRVGGTVGIGITTALNNGTSDNGSAPVSTLSTGIRYEFPLGRPSRKLLETRDMRLDQRTRVGMEFGLQGGVSTRESLREPTDLGLYFGILVNTPWAG